MPLRDEQRIAMGMPTLAERERRIAELKAAKFDPVDVFARDPATGKVRKVTCHRQTSLDEHLAYGWFRTREEAVRDTSFGFDKGKDVETAKRAKARL